LESAAQLSALTSREREVAALVCEGRPNKDIAHELSLSEGTAKYTFTEFFRSFVFRTEAC